MQCCLCLSCPIVLPPNASYCHEAKGMSCLLSFFFFQGNKDPAKLATRMMKNSMLASTAGPVLQDSTSFCDKYQQSVILRVVTYTRDSKSGLETRNWLKIHLLDLKNLPLTIHQEKKQTPSLFLLLLQSSILLPKQNHRTKTLQLTSTSLVFLDHS